MNLGHVFAHGDAVLIAVFLLLAGMSVASWYIMFWKALLLRAEKKALIAFQAARKQYVLGAENLAGVPLSGALRELIHSIEIAGSGDGETLHLALTQSLERIRARLDAGLTWLASIGSSAPFIGLFGTVWGIYNALTDIAAAGNASLNVVAGPMGEALVATAIGLFAAIPAVLAYNAFVRINRLFMQDIRHIAERLELGLNSLRKE